MELFLTHACNLRCTYCYNGRHFRRDLPDDVMDRAIDRAFAEGTGPLGIAFFGGEPLLRMDAIRRGVARARAAADRTGRTVRFRVTTNGLLLDGARLEYLAAERFAVAVSLDGPPDLHDRQRPRVGGSGSHARVVANLRRAMAALPAVNTISVVTPAGGDRAGDVVSHLADLGVRGIHLALDWHSPWTAADLRRLRRGMRAAAGRWAEGYRSGRPIAVSPFDGAVARTVLAGVARLPRCTCGDASEWTVAPSGRIYPCDRMVGEDDGTGTVIGTVDGGFDPAARERFRAARDVTPRRCATCADSARCRFWAACVREPTGGWQAAPTPRLCRLERAVLAAVDEAAAGLFDEGNRPFLDRFYRNATARAAAAKQGLSIEEVLP